MALPILKFTNTLPKQAYWESVTDSSSSAPVCKPNADHYIGTFFTQVELIHIIAVASYKPKRTFWDWLLNRQIPVRKEDAIWFWIRNVSLSYKNKPDLDLTVFGKPPFVYSKCHQLLVPNFPLR